MKCNLICFISGAVVCAALCALGCCPKGREWREKAMEKGREAKRKAQEAWNKMKSDAKERMEPLAAQNDVQ